MNGSEDPERMLSIFRTALVVRLRATKDLSSTASSPDGAGGAWDESQKRDPPESLLMS